MSNQLIMRAMPRGCVWQCYHVETEEEERLLTFTARKNGFFVEKIPAWRAEIDGSTETCPGWRDTDAWKNRPDRDYNKKAEATV